MDGKTVSIDQEHDHESRGCLPDQLMYIVARCNQYSVPARQQPYQSHIRSSRKLAAVESIHKNKANTGNLMRLQHCFHGVVTVVVGVIVTDDIVGVVVVLCGVVDEVGVVIVVVSFLLTTSLSLLALLMSAALLLASFCPCH